MKIVVIGAGSCSFGLGCVADVMANDVLSSSTTELVLLDVDGEKVRKMGVLAERVKAFRKSPVTIRVETDREKALPGADYVLISVARHRWELWEQDYRVPVAHGFRQPYGENGGPGSLFHALRSIHLIMPICRDIERLCPKAFVFNFTNPESYVLNAILKLTGLQAIGLCHGQIEARNAIAKYLDLPAAQIDITGGGLNHFFWLQKIKDRSTGEDLYDKVRAAVNNDEDPARTLVRKMLNIYGMLTYPKDNHVGEYVHMAAGDHDRKWHFGRERVPASRRLSTDLRASSIDKYLDGVHSIETASKPTEELAIPMIVAHATNSRTRFLSGIVMNANLAIPNLFPNGVVEVPVEVDANGIYPSRLDPLPEGIAGFCRTQMTIQSLLVAAYTEKSRNTFLQAMLLDPFVNSIDEANALIDEMFDLQSDFLPELH